MALIDTYANPEWLLLTVQIVDVSEDVNLQELGLVEYNPAISSNWKFYSRLQGSYMHVMKDEFHARSYIRAGVALAFKEITFGIGASFAYCAPMNHNENIIGVFLPVVLF